MDDTFARFASDADNDWIDEFLSEESDNDSDLYDDAPETEFTEDIRGDWS